MSRTKIFLLEDYLDIGELLKDVLVHAGFEVSWFVRARSINSDNIHEGIMVMDADGRESRLDPFLYDVAFIDGRLKGSSLDGWDVVPFLAAAGLYVVACSGDPWINREMIDQGASSSMEKFEIFRLVRTGALELPVKGGLSATGEQLGEDE